MFLSQLPSLLPSSDSVLLIKIALTNDQCGALIGKGGGVITTLQRSCGVLIKAGSVDELFPGTPFRPAIIRGTIDGIHACLTELVKILHRDHLLRTETEATPAVPSLLLNPPSMPPAIRHQDFAVRLLIPDSAAGAIIGKQGSVIRALCDNSGASIRLSAPDQQRDNTIFERVVAVSGSGPSVVSAVVSIFLTLASDSRHLMYSNPTVVYPRIIDGYTIDNGMSNSMLMNHPPTIFGSNTVNFSGMGNLSANNNNNNNSNPFFLPNNSNNNNDTNRLLNNGNHHHQGGGLLNGTIGYEPALTMGNFHNNGSVHGGNNPSNEFFNNNGMYSPVSNAEGTLSDNGNKNTGTNAWFSPPMTTKLDTNNSNSSSNSNNFLINPSLANYNLRPNNNGNPTGEISSYLSLTSMTASSAGNKSFGTDSPSSFGSEMRTLSPLSIAETNNSNSNNISVANENEAAMLAARHALANGGYGNMSMFANHHFPQQPPLPMNAPPPLPSSHFPYASHGNNNYKPSPPLPTQMSNDYHPAYASILMSSPIDNLLRDHRENQSTVSSLSNTLPLPTNNNNYSNPPLPNNFNSNRPTNISSTSGHPSMNSSPSRNFVSSTSTNSSGYGNDSRNGNNEHLRNNYSLHSSPSSSSSLPSLTTGGQSTNSSITGTSVVMDSNKYTNENFHNNLIPEQLHNQLSSLNL